MSWASMRETTRLEDEAYCLLGIFGINMPLLYGEGARAFQRLQHEIIKTATELSFMAHTSTSSCNLLATSARAFRHCQGLESIPYIEELSITNKGLKLESALFCIRPKAEGNGYVCPGSHHSLVIAHIPLVGYLKTTDPTVFHYGMPQLLRVCFQRVSEKDYIRHPNCHTPHADGTLLPDIPSLGRSAPPLGVPVLEDNAHFLFQIRSYRQGEYHERKYEILLPSNDVLGMKWPVAYPIRSWNNDHSSVLLPARPTMNNDQIFIVSTPSPDTIWPSTPMIVVRAIVVYIIAVGGHEPTVHWRLTGYFLTSSEAERDVRVLAKTQTNEAPRFNLTDNSFSAFESILKKHARTSVRCRREDASDMFLAISFKYDIRDDMKWHMEFEHITKRQHYQNELKIRWHWTPFRLSGGIHHFRDFRRLAGYP